MVEIVGQPQVVDAAVAAQSSVVEAKSASVIDQNEAAHASAKADEVATSAKTDEAKKKEKKEGAEAKSAPVQTSPEATIAASPIAIKA